jgi:hypothetical protein
VSLTGWFRFPGGGGDSYISDAGLAGLREAGFDHLRLPVHPDYFGRPALRRALARIQAAGLTAIPALFADSWHLEAEPVEKLARFWAAAAPGFAGFDPARLVLEMCNEPVFPGVAGDWAARQRMALAAIRAVLPRFRVLLTGANWGGIDGLLALPPAADPNVLYSVHFYEPAELTALAAYRQDLDRQALARLPFPVGADCVAAAGNTDATTRDVAKYYCGLGWDAARIGARFDQVAAYARSAGTPVLLGEFGASARLNPAARHAWLGATRRAAESRGFGWTLWGLDDVMGFDLPRPLPARLALDASLRADLGL